MERSDISYLEVKKYMRPMDDSSYMKALHRRLGIPTQDLDKRYGPAILQPKDEALISEGRVTDMTTARLQGAKEVLNGDSLILSQNFLFPTEISKDAVVKFLYNKALPRTAISLISIQEPGKFSPTHSEFQGFFRRTIPSASTGVEGVTRFLNYSRRDFEDYERYEDKITKLTNFVLEIRRDEQEHVHDLLSGLSLPKPRDE